MMMHGKAALAVAARPFRQRTRPPCTIHSWFGIDNTFYEDAATFRHQRRSSSHSTSKKFPHLNAPTAQDAHELLSRMGNRPGSVLTTFNGNVTTAELEKYNVDWTRHYRGEASIVLRPRSTKEVVQIVEYCNANRLGIVPQGGNTGLVGGSVPLSSQEIVLSLERMNQIHSAKNGDSTAASNIVRADAGCILQDLQEFAATHMKCLVPVDLGAKGTCQIGGNLSTNAGGVYYYRYGSLHANCLGLELVVPNSSGGAQVLNLSYHPATHLKDNTGYDLKHLFIGAEGTLGIVTKVALLCPPLPTSIGAVWLTCQSLHDVIQILSLAKTKYLTEVLAAFEFMDHDVLGLVEETHGGSVKLPVGKASYSVLIETHGSNQEHDQDKLAAFLESIMEKHLVMDGVLAQNLGQVDEFWKVRDMCNPAAAATGFVYKYDISLAAIDFDSFIQEIKSQLASFARKDLLCVNWGHLIDGNLHCNIVSKASFERDTELTKFVDQSILEAVLKRNGSISAEHGLGQYKNNYMPLIKDASTLRTMKQVKNLFDPHGILNPGKYLPEDE